MTAPWQQHAERLASEITHDRSRWRRIVATTPRHAFVPHWWDMDHDRWTLHTGNEAPDAWLTAAYRDQTLITSVAGHHADHAKPADHPEGLPTSSATLPSLVLRMYGHAHLHADAAVLDVGTGSGYGTALLSKLLGDKAVTSIDVDPAVATAAAEHLDRLGLNPDINVRDATGPLDGMYDRIVAMTSVRPIPRSWLSALHTGGRIVTVIAGTSAILTATRIPDNDGPIVAEGRIEWDRAMFMQTRNGPDYPHDTRDRLTTAREAVPEHESTSPYPLVDVSAAWDLRDMLEVTTPGIHHDFHENGDQRTAIMAHDDGSWARATSHDNRPPLVHQGGPRRLWDTLDSIRERWLTTGELPLRGAKAWITGHGVIHIARGDWRTTIR